jgi:outer membrane protein assembly factor BamB
VVAEVHPFPTAVENIVAVNDTGVISVVDGCSGAPVWSERDPGPIQTPAVLGGVKLGDGTTHTIIVVCMGDGSVRALDAGTGAELWSYDTRDPGPVNVPSAYGSGKKARVVFADGSSVVELNASKGKLVWSTDTGATIAGGVAIQGVPAGSLAPLGDPGPTQLIAGNDDGDLVALDPATGSVNWSDGDPGPISTPAVANGVVYFTTGFTPGAPAGLVAVNALDGGPLMREDDLNPQPFPPGPPSIGDGMVFTGNFSGSIAVFLLAG